MKNTKKKIDKEWFLDRIYSNKRCEYSMRGLARALENEFGYRIDVGQLSRCFSGSRKMTIEEVCMISKLIDVDRNEIIDKLVSI